MTQHDHEIILIFARCRDGSNLTVPNLTKGADSFLDNDFETSLEESCDLSLSNLPFATPTTSLVDRRIFMGTAALLLGTSSAFVATAVVSRGIQPAIAVSTTASAATYGKLEWESTPINKRTGITLTDAEKAGYNVRFVTYLARFLLVFDYDCQRWWYSRAADIPPLSSAEQVESIRLKQFGAVAASVEVGLQDYAGGRCRNKKEGDSDGPLELIQALLERYCPTIEAVREERETRGIPPLSEQEEAKERREIKEARQQIALLFGLPEETQPVEDLDKLLASIDNGSISSVTIVDGGSCYAPGYGPPRVEFPPPTAGDEYAVEKQIQVYVDPPPLTARINMNNPLTARIVDPTKPLPPTTIPSAQERRKLISSTNIE